MYEILYQSNIDDISSICQSNKNALHICNNKHFWKNYFMYHHLPILTNEQTAFDWINEFKTVQTTINISNQLFDLIDHQHLDLIGFDIEGIYKLPFLPIHLINDISKMKRHVDFLLYKPYGLGFKFTTNDNVIYYMMGETRMLSQILQWHNIDLQGIKTIIFDFIYYCVKNNILIRMRLSNNFEEVELKKIKEMYPTLFEKKAIQNQSCIII